jgi:hypothetical protein
VSTVFEFLFKSVFVILIGVLALIAFAVAMSVDLFDTMRERRRPKPTLRSWNLRKHRVVESFVH